MACVCELASFVCQVRGIKFYEVPTSEVNVGDQIHLTPEPENLWDSNYISVMTISSSGLRKLGYLAREVSCYLSPLLGVGFQASG